MSNKIYEEKDIQEIADAIRYQNGTDNTYSASEMADAIYKLKPSAASTSDYEIVNDIGEMTDISNSYLLNKTGTIWKYNDSTELPELYDPSAITLGKSYNHDCSITDDSTYIMTGFISAYASKHNNLKIIITGDISSDYYDPSLPYFKRIVYFDKSYNVIGVREIITGKNNTGDFVKTDLGEGSTTLYVGYKDDNTKEIYFDHIAYVKIEVKVVTNGSTSTIEHASVIESITSAYDWYDTNEPVIVDSSYALQSFPMPVDVSVTGEKKVSINNVSSVDHSIKICLKNNNLLNVSECVISNGTKDGNNIKSNMNAKTYIAIRSTGLEELFLAHKGETVTFSLADAHDRGIRVYLTGTFEGTTSTSKYFAAKSGDNFVTFTIPENLIAFTSTAGRGVEFRINYGSSITDTESVFSKIMLNYGDEILPYSPCYNVSGQTIKIYNDETSDEYINYFTDDNGTVTDILRIFPTMIIKTNSSAPMTVSYKCDVNSLNQTENLDKIVNSNNLVDMSIPYYWEEKIEEKVNSINTIIRNAISTGSNVATFFVRADAHYPFNSGVSTKLMKYIQKKCGVSLTIDAGDIITDTDVYSTNIESLNIALSHLTNGSDRFLITQGNHDTGNQIGTLSPDRRIYDNEWKSHVISKIVNYNAIKFYDNGKAYYYDDPVQKIRFISIDAFETNRYKEDNTFTLGRMKDDQITWIETVALNDIPSGYSVVSFSHYALNGTVIDGVDTPITKGVLAADTKSVADVFSEFITNGGTYIGHFSGHNHYDFLSTTNNITDIRLLNDGTAYRDVTEFNTPKFEQNKYYSSNGDATYTLLSAKPDDWMGGDYYTKNSDDDYIAVDFAIYNDGKTIAYINETPKKTSETITECAFDVAIIDTTLGKGTLVRIGAGETTDTDGNIVNREWTYVTNLNA